MTREAKDESLELRDHDAAGYWASDDRRYFEAANELLEQLELAVVEVKRLWPIDLDQTVMNGREYPALWRAVRARDLLADSTKIFAALAVEGFLNYYGVVRLGEQQYMQHFERLGLAKKCKCLLRSCDRARLEDDGPLLSVVKRIADRRNALVHPKAKEFAQCVSFDQRPGSKTPDSAREAVADMEAFFREFVAIVPQAQHLVPPSDEAREPSDL